MERVWPLLTLLNDADGEFRVNKYSYICVLNHLQIWLARLSKMWWTIMRASVSVCVSASLSLSVYVTLPPPPPPPLSLSLSLALCLSLFDIGIKLHKITFVLAHYFRFKTSSCGLLLANHCNTVSTARIPAKYLPHGHVEFCFSLIRCLPIFSVFFPDQPDLLGGLISVAIVPF